MLKRKAFLVSASIADVWETHCDRQLESIEIIFIKTTCAFTQIIPLFAKKKKRQQRDKVCVCVCRRRDRLKERQKRQNSERGGKGEGHPKWLGSNYEEHQIKKEKFELIKKVKTRNKYQEVNKKKKWRTEEHKEEIGYSK